MSQRSLSSDASLLVRDGRGRYLPASADQILDAARRVIDQKMRRGAEFSSPETVKEYLRTKLAGFDHEVFAVLFLDARHRLIEYVEMFRGTIDGAEVHPREVVKEALKLPLFHGHLTVWIKGVRNAQNPPAVSSGISTTNPGARPLWAHAR